MMTMKARRNNMDEIATLLESWVNGNHHDVLNIILKRRSRNDAILLALELYETMEIVDRAMFLRMFRNL